MKPYKVIIADDEDLTRERIRNLVGLCPDFKVVKEASNGMESLKFIQMIKPDVVFLDIKMPFLDGFQILQKLDSNSYGVLVFITAHDEFALQAFDFEALDYLLKPFDDQRFGKLMTRVRHNLSLNEEQRNNQLIIKDRREIYPLLQREIVYIQSHNNHIRIFMEGRDLRTRDTLKSILSKLNRSFFRIHRSYIINEKQVLKMKHLEHGDYLFEMTNGKKIPSSRSYREAVRYLTHLSFTPKLDSNST